MNKYTHASNYWKIVFAFAGLVFLYNLINGL